MVKIVHNDIIIHFCCLFRPREDIIQLFSYAGDECTHFYASNWLSAPLGDMMDDECHNLTVKKGCFK